MEMCNVTKKQGAKGVDEVNMTDRANYILHIRFRSTHSAFQGSPQG